MLTYDEVMLKVWDAAPSWECVLLINGQASTFEHLLLAPKGAWVQSSTVLLASQKSTSRTENLEGEPYISIIIIIYTIVTA